MKFSIRDLLLVTVIVALAVASCLTWLDRQRLVKENGQLREEAKVAKAREVKVNDTILQVLRSLPRREKQRSEFDESRSIESRGFGGFDQPKP